MSWVDMRETRVIGLNVKRKEIYTLGLRTVAERVAFWHLFPLYVIPFGHAQVWLRTPQSMPVLLHEQLDPFIDASVPQSQWRLPEFQTRLELLQTHCPAP